MADSRESRAGQRKRLMQWAVLVALGAILVALWWPVGFEPVEQGQALARPGLALEDDPAVPPDIPLEALDAARPEPGSTRELFRFGADTPAPPAGGGPLVPGGGASDIGVEEPDEPPEPTPPVDPGPPPPPPISLRYIGYAESPGVGKVAGLADGRFVYYGRQGDIIDGRYRIVSIDTESVVIERVDGTGRQRIALSGR